MISITHYTELIVLQVSIIIISLVTCEVNVIDYDLPAKDDSNYRVYYSRPYARYGQQKLKPTEFFKSIYNAPSRVLPEPHSPLDYKLYKKQLKEKDAKIDLQKLSEIYHKAEEPGNQSNIYEKEYESASEYLKDFVGQEPLKGDIYYDLLQVMELAPKPYETEVSFYKARIQLGKMLIENTISLLNMTDKQKEKLKKLDENHEYETNLIELSIKDVLIKGESYGQYVLRMVILGKSPLDRKTCAELYKIQFPVDSALLLEMKDDKFKKLAEDPDLVRKGETLGQHLRRTLDKDTRRCSNKTFEIVYEIKFPDETPNRMFRDISLMLTPQPLDKKSSKRPQLKPSRKRRFKLRSGTADSEYSYTISPTEKMSFGLSCIGIGGVGPMG